jgi:hypothetical protein
MSLLPYASLTHRRKAYRAGDVVLLSTQTASGDTSITFSSDITSTYGEYIFKFYNVNPADDVGILVFQVNATDGADYNDSAITSTMFRSKHTEDDATTALEYTTGNEQAQGTAFNHILQGIGNGADESGAGELHLFNPASTTYVKHFYSIATELDYRDMQVCWRGAGYINDTTAIDDIRFKMDSGGEFDGKFKMWGVK